jgi:hypothetical protein
MVVQHAAVDANEGWGIPNRGRREDGERHAASADILAFEAGRAREGAPEGDEIGIRHEAGRVDRIQQSRDSRAFAIFSAGTDDPTQTLVHRKCSDVSFSL